jgi:hypothetical protein
VPDAVLCPANTPTTLVRNVAARGRLRTFSLRVGHPATGSVTVRSGPLPFFVLSSRRTLPLADGLRIKRAFFDASFEVVVLADEAVNVRLD